MNPFTINNTTAAPAIKVVQNADTSNSTSSGGAINIDNTNNTGAGLVIYSAQNDSATGHLINGRADNPLFDQQVIYATSKGQSHTALLMQTGVGTNAAALNVASSNPNFSAMGLSGTELTHGTIKITHTGTGNDVNAAAISVDLEGNGTAAQGLYMNSIPGTTGKLLFIQNQTVPRMILYGDGHLAVYGDIEVADSVHGIIMQDRAQPGTKYRVFINNGQLGIEKL